MSFISKIAFGTSQPAALLWHPHSSSHRVLWPSLELQKTIDFAVSKESQCCSKKISSYIKLHFRLLRKFACVSPPRWHRVSTLLILLSHLVSVQNIIVIFTVIFVQDCSSFCSCWMYPKWLITVAEALAALIHLMCVCHMAQRRHVDCFTKFGLHTLMSSSHVCTIIISLTPIVIKRQIVFI